MPIQPKDLQIDLFDRVDEAINQLGKLNLVVGWFEGAKYDDDTPVASVAIQNEYGNPLLNIPPRPFVRPTIAEQRGNWRKAFRSAARAIIRGRETPEQVMEKIGLVVSGQLRKAIAQIHDPPLSPRTIKARLSVRADKQTIGQLDKPLVFEGFLLNSISYSVNGGEIKEPYSRGQQP